MCLTNLFKKMLPNIVLNIRLRNLSRRNGRVSRNLVAVITRHLLEKIDMTVFSKSTRFSFRVLLWIIFC